MKKNILIFLLYLLIHFCFVQVYAVFSASFFFVLVGTLFLLSFLMATICSFTKKKYIKWNIPMWFWTIWGNILLLQTLFSRVTMLMRDDNGMHYHQTFKGEPELRAIWFLLGLLIPFFLLLWGAWKEKISTWQLKWATFVMLTTYPLACVYHYFDGQFWLAQLFNYMKG